MDEVTHEEVFPFSPRVDLLTQPPRLAADWHLRPFTLADLATSKKTQRADKDWTMVTLLGVRLLGQGDAAGLWNIVDAPALLQAVALRPDLAAHLPRPTVQLALQGCAEDALSAAWRLLNRGSHHRRFHPTHLG